MPAANVDEYLAALQPEVVAAVNEIRAAIVDVLDEPTETIAYGIPTFKVGGRNVVHVGGYRRFVSVYPVPDDATLLTELTPYRVSQGTLRFPLDRPLPIDLIRRVVTALALARRKT